QVHADGISAHINFFHADVQPALPVPRLQFYKPCILSLVLPLVLVNIRNQPPIIRHIPTVLLYDPSLTGAFLFIWTNASSKTHEKNNTPLLYSVCRRGAGI